MKNTALCRTIISIVPLILGTLSMFAAPSIVAADKDGWTNLFDGKSLEGWIQKNGTATYRVENGTIVGKTNEGSPNSFLCTTRDYADFELEFEVKVDDRLNSGVQLRSKTNEPKAGEKFGVVNGPQVEIEASLSSGAEAGYVYGESTKYGWLTPASRLKPHKHFKDGEWNKYRVVAKGPRIQTWINDQPIDDLTHEEIYQTHPTGFISLQVHGIAKGEGPYEVAWRNIRIRELGK